MAVGNPFVPSFGTSPPLLAGRDDLLADIGDALAAGPAHPDYTTLLIGVRGSGKTVVLNALEDLAHRRGWVTLAEDASPPLIGRLTRAVSELLDGLEDAPRIRRRVSGVRFAGVGIDLEPETGSDISSISRDLRSLLSRLGGLLADEGTGLLITLDELNSGKLEEVREFGNVLQHVTRREQNPIALVGAALPQIEDTILAGPTATFLQRCSRYDIGRLDTATTSLALSEPISQRGATIDRQALVAAVEATSGYPFMIQLVGFHTWKASRNPVAGITTADVTSGVAEAEDRLGRLVFTHMWGERSAVDKKFLLAMTVDEGRSRLTSIAERLGVGTNYAGVYRRRLISAGVIVSAGRGFVDFSHWAARRWIRGKRQDDQT